MSADTVSSRRDLADAMARAARTMHAHRSVDEVLDLIVHSASETIPGINHVGVSVTHRDGRVDTRAASDDLVIDLDKLQYELAEGPCIDALRNADFVQVDRVPDDQRWPRYSPRAAKAGIRSQMAFRLYTDDATLGGLNLYSTESETLNADARHIAALFATHAALALGKAREESTLHAALQTRGKIGQAIGIIQERYELNEDRAFEFLTRVSQTGNIKLRDVATELVEQANRRHSSTS
jgi:transcriptional regulator with GAF, ATPase, and Fis domain